MWFFVVRRGARAAGGGSDAPAPAPVSPGRQAAGCAAAAERRSWREQHAAGGWQGCACSVRWQRRWAVSGFGGLAVSGLGGGRAVVGGRVGTWRRARVACVHLCSTARRRNAAPKRASRERIAAHSPPSAGASASCTGLILDPPWGGAAHEQCSAAREQSSAAHEQCSAARQRGTAHDVERAANCVMLFFGRTKFICYINLCSAREFTNNQLSKSVTLV